MTSDIGRDHEDLFLADFYPELGEYLAGQCAAGYDARAGRARFRDWLLAHAEHPRSTLDYSYQQQLDMLTRVRRGVADVARSRRRVELQISQLMQEATGCEDEAREALRCGREDLAREALMRKASLGTRLDDLQTQYDSLHVQEEKLTTAAQRLLEKVEAFRARTETAVTGKPTAQVQAPDAGADPVKDYLDKVRKIPPLNAEQEVELAKRIQAGAAAEEKLAAGAGLDGEQRLDLEWIADDGQRAKNRLLEANLRLVVSLAKSFTGRGRSLLDLVQEGNLGLIRAVEKFDHATGYRFATHATWWIRQAITRAIANQPGTIHVTVRLAEDSEPIPRSTPSGEDDGGESASKNS